MKRKRLQASYTVEAAGVMAAVLVTVMLILRAAFSLQAEIARIMNVHQEVEVQRHAISESREKQIVREAQGQNWSIQITAPVFRPEESLRLWSLVEEKQ